MHIKEIGNAGEGRFNLSYLQTQEKFAKLVKYPGNCPDKSSPVGWEGTDGNYKSCNDETSPKTPSSLVSILNAHPRGLEPRNFWFWRPAPYQFGQGCMLRRNIYDVYFLFHIIERLLTL